MNYKIINNDCLIEMQNMESNSIDFIVTDPPYGVSFMSKHWDKEIPPAEYWKEMLRICKPGSYMACAGLPRTMHRLTSTVEDSGWIIRDMLIHIFGSGFPKSNNFGKQLADDWNGYGTALKPAWEGWTLAMKPLDGTFIENAEKWGVSGINIDLTRISTSNFCSIGRWPANLILDESSAEELDRMTGILKSGGGDKHSRSKNTFMASTKWEDLKGTSNGGDSGGASRFFYCAKSSKKERGKENNHPTVKPISLMKYIIKLLAPPHNPVLLDPFCGSGSTLIAAKELGVSAIGIEKEKEYCEIAEKRLQSAKSSQNDFFTN